MVDHIKVFVSYSWRIEDETGIVGELEAQCRERNIFLVRDNKKLQHGDLIREFMDKLSGSERIITVFSDAYFRSKWCMYELLETWRKGDFKDRTHPIKADDCNLQNDNYRIELTDFWEEKYRTADANLKGRDPIVFTKEYEQVEIYRDVYQNINKLLNFAAGRVTTPLEQLRKEDYAQLLDLIQPKQAGRSYPSDDDFLEEIKEILAQDLKKSELFRDHVIKNCDLDYTDAAGLHGYLVDECLKGEFVQIIQNLQSAFVDSYEELESSDILAIRKLYQAAEDTLSKLVLFNVKNDWMAQYCHERSQNNQHDHLLPDMSFGSVEVVISREAQTIPRFQFGRHDLNLQGAKGVALESGIRSKDIVRDIIKRLFHRVMEQEISSQLDEEKAIGILQRTIQQRKQHKNLKLRKNYFLLIPSDSSSPLADVTVQKELKRLLPDLSFIRIKSGKVEETFIVEDADLMVAISEFYKTLEEHKPQ
ncbi:toll/interleukin-1 receptor domain-containing protein [Nitrosomonas sp.]|uniref:toll/interleukin-1 receptor domain-containing protein n=1 Tax=Nitrosomonas sp. TaxID=42353 RepID=UPI00374CAB83